MIAAASNSAQSQANGKITPYQASISKKENKSPSASSKARFVDVEPGYDSDSFKGKSYVMLYLLTSKFTLLFHFGSIHIKAIVCFKLLTVSVKDFLSQ